MFWADGKWVGPPDEMARRPRLRWLRMRPDLSTFHDLLRSVTVCVLLVLAACGSDTIESNPPAVPEPSSSSSNSTLPEKASASTGLAGAETATTPGPVTTEEDPTNPVDGYEPLFHPGPCPFEIPPGTDPRCGRLTVPEDRDEPTGRLIELAVAIFPANSEEKYPPVVYLEGGPGGDALDTLSFSYHARFGFLDQERTVIVFDQRGVGHSTPSLACPDLLDLTYDLLDEDLPIEEYAARGLAVVNRCKEGWLPEGVDLSRYNSAESATDVADLRVALGHEEWDLYGVSYGTRLALTVMRDHPEGIRSVILDATYPPEVDGVAMILPGAHRSFSELFGACASDTKCSSTYGDLESLLFSTVDRLDADPAEIWVVDFRTLEGYPALLSGEMLLDLVYQGLYSDLIIPVLPQLVADVSQGEYFKAQALLSLILTNQAYFSVGQFLSVQCHEEVPFSDPALVSARAAEYSRLAPLIAGALVQSEAAFRFCREWGAGAADPIENQPVESNIPTLVLAGRFDPITPPEFGQRVARNLGNSWYVEFPTLGHGVASSDWCTRSITLAFLDDPSTRPDNSCVSDMSGIVFSTFEPTPEIDLVPARVGPYQVPVPEGWVGERGFYERGWVGDLTSFLVIPGPSGLGETILSAVTRTWSGITIEESGVLEIGDRIWRRLSAEAGSVSIDAALHDGDTGSIVVLLVSDQREREHLLETVVLPALESLSSAGP